MTLEQFCAVFASIVTVVTCTWALKSELSAIREALAGHVAEDKEKFAGHEARIIKIESVRGRRK